MEHRYTMHEITAKVNRSEQAIYRLMKSNNELKAIISEHSYKVGGRRTLYGSTVLDWLKEYYNVVQASSEAPDAPPDVEQAEVDPEDNAQHEAEIAALRAEIAALQRDVESLRSDLALKEQERQALFVSNGQLLLLLSQEKQEKQALLPKPRQPFTNKLIALFKRSSDAHE